MHANGTGLSESDRRLRKIYFGIFVLDKGQIKPTLIADLYQRSCGIHAEFRPNPCGIPHGFGLKPALNVPEYCLNEGFSNAVYSFEEMFLLKRSRSKKYFVGSGLTPKTSENQIVFVELL